LALRNFWHFPIPGCNPKAWEKPVSYILFWYIYSKYRKKVQLLQVGERCNHKSCSN
jgi:hypothetical protein